MSLDWNEHPEAREEFLHAHERYLKTEAGRLGDEFADAVEEAAGLMLKRPEAPPQYRGRRRVPAVRTWHLGKFPYNLIYAVGSGEIYILAYAHESRRPGYWAHRLND